MICTDDYKEQNIIFWKFENSTFREKSQNLKFVNIQTRENYVVSDEFCDTKFISGSNTIILGV